MNRLMRGLILLLPLLVLAVPPVLAQEDPQAALSVVRIEAEPSTIEVRVGESVPLTFHAYDADGNVVDTPMRLAFPRGYVWAEDGYVHGLVAGSYEVTANLVLPADAVGEPAQAKASVEVLWPAITEVDVTRDPGSLYQGTTIRHRAIGLHPDGSPRPDPQVTWRSSDPSIASVNRAGDVTAHSPGEVQITAEIEGVSASVTHEVAPIPASDFRIEATEEVVRTGDVIAFQTSAREDSGSEVNDLPVTWSFTYEPPVDFETVEGPGQISDDGRFVADRPGRFTILAQTGALSDRYVVDVEPREVTQEFVVEGQGRVSDQQTSDFWPWEGHDGRDYAITGTWNADGWAFIWDITDPASLVKTDSVQVDARTVNDVKVSPDGRYAVMTREGAVRVRNRDGGGDDGIRTHETVPRLLP